MVSGRVYNAEIMKTLLGHPDIDVNLQNKVELYCMEVMYKFSSHVSITHNDVHATASHF